MSVVGFIIDFPQLSESSKETINISNFDPDAEFDETEINEAIASPDKKIRADAIERLAQHSWQNGNGTKATIYLESVVDLRTELEDYAGLSWAYTLLGHVHNGSSHFEEAFNSYRLAAENARKAMNVTAEIDALHAAATAQRRLKNYEQAAEFFGQAAALAAETDYRFVAHIKADYARMLRKIGRTHEAEVLLAEASDYMMSHGFENILPKVENELASALFDDSNPQLSLEKATEAYHLAKYDENDREADRAQYLMARCHNKLGNFGEALKILEEMKSRQVTKKRQKHRARTDLELAHALIGLERRYDASVLLQKLIPVLKAHKLFVEAADALCTQGQNLLIIAEPLDAEQLLIEAYNIAEEHDLERASVEAATLLAICYDGLGRTGNKMHYYEIVASNPLNYGRLEFWMAAGDLALEYAKMFEVETSRRYVKVIDSSKSPLISLGIRAQVQEAKAWFASMEGALSRAKTWANKAMANYLLDDRAADATRVARFISELSPLDAAQKEDRKTDPELVRTCKNQIIV